MLAPLPCDLLADVVAGAVDEAIAVAGLLDHVAGGVVDLPALQRLVRRRRRRCTFAMAASRAAATMSKIFAYFAGTVLADEARRGSGRCRPHRGRFELGPEVDQHEVALADRRVGRRARFVVRVAAVRADADDRRAVGRQAC